MACPNQPYFLASVAMGRYNSCMNYDRELEFQISTVISVSIR